MARRPIAFVVLASIVVFVALAGCGGTRLVDVTGTVLKDGKPIEVGATGVVQVTLVPDVPAGTQYTTHVGRCDSTGKFAVTEVPVGKYRVAIEQFDPTPQVDKLGGEFSAGKTQFVREVDGKTPLQIDLAQPGA